MILVTGATGTIGRHVVRELADSDRSIRVGLRTPAEAETEISSVADVVAFDFEKPETWGDTLAGVDRLFLLRPPGVGTETIGQFAAAAARTGVDHVVYLSGYGAGRNPLNPHFWIERRIRSVDVPNTLLRASYFMQNLSQVHGPDIVDRGEIIAPAGEGEISFVDARDVGAVAATVLTEPGHENSAYDVTGPEALDFHEVASIFSTVLERQITYPDPSLFTFAKRMRHRGLSPGYILLVSSIYTTVRLGFAGRVTNETAEILGREPRRMREYVEASAVEFRTDTN